MHQYCVMKHYGLLGYPLSHSFSVGYFTEKFKRESIEAAYENFPLPSIENFPDLIKERPDLSGLNVTIPYKQTVMPFLHEFDAEAKAIGAVNVIRFIRNTEGVVRLKGYNTDVIGFRESIRSMINVLIERLTADKQIDNKLNALVLGTGGSSKAVCHALRQLNIGPTSVSRTAKDGTLSYEELTPDLYDLHRIIVNTTPLGMSPNVEGCPALDYAQLGTGHLLFDLVYNPQETVFLQKGRERGCLIKNGKDMLQLQAEASWEIWNT